MTRRIRLTVVLTHPIQYYSPWFRFIVREVDELHLSVLYVTEPSPDQQGVGFETPFQWDVPLREGYENVVFRPSSDRDSFASDRFLGLDAPGIGHAIARLEPDVVLLSGWHSIALVRALFGCRRHGIPVLYRGDTHMQGREGMRALWRWRTRWLLHRFDRFLSVGKRVADTLLRLGIPGSHVFSSPHAVDNEFFAAGAAPLRDPGVRSEARRAWGIAPDEFVVLFVGKLDSNKRPMDLLHAARRMEGPSRVVMVGSGPLRTECLELSSRLAIPVVLPGFVNQSKLPALYAISDVVALPSQRESWGLVVNEALAAGVPAVVSDGVGCAPDLVEPGRTGEIHPVGDVAGLASCLERIEGEVERGDRRTEWCRQRIAAYGLDAATAGLLSACKSAISS